MTIVDKVYYYLEVLENYLLYVLGKRHEKFWNKQKLGIGFKLPYLSHVYFDIRLRKLARQQLSHDYVELKKRYNKLMKEYSNENN